MKTLFKWRTAPISSTCQVRDIAEKPCGKPTVRAHPAWGWGWMALCEEHGKKHADYAPTIEKLIQQGETLG